MTTKLGPASSVICLHFRHSNRPASCIRHYFSGTLLCDQQLRLPLGLLRLPLGLDVSRPLGRALALVQTLALAQAEVLALALALALAPVPLVLVLALLPLILLTEPDPSMGARAPLRSLPSRLVGVGVVKVGYGRGV